MLQSLIRRKSGRLVQARFLEAVGRFGEAVALYQEVARDEEEIARQLKKTRGQAEAAVNLVSAASCWRKARHQANAIRLLDEVLAIQAIPDALRDEVNALRQEWMERPTEDARHIIPGVFRHGAVYLLEKVSIAEGTVVTITLPTVHG
jgi:hypothetical protein